MHRLNKNACIFFSHTNFDIHRSPLCSPSSPPASSASFYWYVHCPREINREVNFNPNERRIGPILVSHRVPYCTPALVSAWRIFWLFFRQATNADVNKAGTSDSHAALTPHSEIKKKKSTWIDAKVTGAREKGNRNQKRLVGSEEKSGGGIYGERRVFVAQTESINQKLGCKVRVQRLNWKTTRVAAAFHLNSSHPLLF